MDGYIPAEISVHKKEKELVVVWNDGHTSIYPLALVRYACPCAECRGGHDQMRAEPPQEVFYVPIEDAPATRLVALEKVGTYGITIGWEDGHQFGIYTWHYLRALCPCRICREMMIYGQ
ncbi:MAG: gamma-butyrobetaine hydroxylase-like domain-containing protein [Acidobacteriaceae bacterium]